MDELDLSGRSPAGAEGVMGGVGKGGVGMPGTKVGVGRKFDTVGSPVGTASLVAGSVAQLVTKKRSKPAKIIRALTRKHTRSLSAK